MKKKDRYFIIVDCRQWFSTVLIKQYDYQADKFCLKGNLIYNGINEKEPIEIWTYEYDKELSKYKLVDYGKEIKSYYGSNYKRAIKTFSSLAEAEMHCIIEGLECFSRKRSSAARFIKDIVSFSEFQKTFRRIF